MDLGTGNRVFTVGRSGDNTVVLESPDVSRHHLKITELREGFLVEDLGSRNGTHCNGARVQKQMFQSTDTLYLGAFRFPLSSLKGIDLFGPGLTPESNTDALVVTIGRDERNHIVLPLPQVSKFHARIAQSGSNWTIEDLGSTNGTFVDGVRIMRTTLFPGARVRIASYIWNWEDELNQTDKFQFLGGLSVIASGVSLNNGGRLVLDQISLSIDPGKLVAIVGPSGSGKSSFINVLRGVVTPSSGNVAINNKSLSESLQELLGQIGYVPQDDIIHSELTVFESLYYSAKLRLPDDTSDAELDQRVNNVIKELGLNQVRDSRIGTPERRGISGGERKRVNVAQELITEPAILFLDEPTSGLDPLGDNDVMSIMRGLSDKGKTVVLSTHNVTHELFQLIDQLLVLAKGKLLYFGSPENAMKFFDVSQPAEIFRVIKNESHEVLSARFGKSLEQEPSASQLESVHSSGLSHSLSSVVRKHSASRQLGALIARDVTRKIRDEINFAVLLLQAPIIGVLIGLVLKDDKNQINVLFLMVISAIWFGCLSAARELVAERSIYLRERLINLKIPVYLSSKFIVLAGISMIQCLLLVLIVAIFVSFKGSLLTIFWVLLLSAFGGIGLGLCLSSFASSAEAAIAMTPVVLIPQIMFGGIFRTLPQMGDFIEPIAGVVFSRWACEALIGLNHPEHLKSFYGISASQMLTDTTMLVSLTIIFFLFSGVCLRRMDPF